MAASKYKQHFVFDLDDTLIDGRQFCGETMALAIVQLESKVNQQEVIDLHEVYRGGMVVDLYTTVLAEMKLELDLDKLLELDAAIQLAECDRMKLFGGVKEIFDLLKKRGKTLHICTNRKSDTLRAILDSLKITNYFDTITSCIDKGHKKPNPDCLLDLVNQYGGDKSQFIYFGDSVIDSQFAANSGIEYIIFDQYLNGKNLFKKLIDLFLEEQI